ncbi:hypothetical protein C8J57DRAFT_287226 [Mycena rebaudengoi]|nr:hypothetical protein C8J57DRAFT_287226 [Mycena rebaudengoi]
MRANLYYGEQMWINHRDFEGGPVAYFGTHISDWYNTFGQLQTSQQMSSAMDSCSTDATSFGGVRASGLSPSPPSFSLDLQRLVIVMTIQSGLPGGDIFHGTAVNFGIPWLVLTIVFNILVTGMIGFRLISISRSMRNVLSKERADVYVGVIAILVESAAPFTLLGIAYLVTYIRNDPEVWAFADVWGMFCALSPQAIILRVAMGSAWSRKTMTQYESNSGTAVVFTNPGRRTMGSQATKLKSMGSVNGNSTLAVMVESKQSRFTDDV